MLRRTIFGKANITPIAQPNLFIKGVGDIVTTKALLATYLICDESIISYFLRTSDDIEARIESNHLVGGLNDNSWKINMRSFRETEGRITVFSHYWKRDYAPKMEQILLYGTSLATDNLSYCDARLYYIPNATTLGSNTANNNVFLEIGLNATICCHPSLETNNAGAPDGDIVYARDTRGATIVYGAQPSLLTPPNTITNLSTTSVYATVIQLNWTPPTGSANVIEYYKAYVDGVYIKKVVSGDYLSDLTASATHTIEVKPVDIYGNHSSSNILNVTMNGVDTVFSKTANVVTHYKLRSNVIDSVGARNGTPVNMSYSQNYDKGIKTARFDGSTSKFTMDLSSIVTNTATMSVWIKLKNNQPAAASRAGLMNLNSGTLAGAYPFTNGKCYNRILTDVRKNDFALSAIDRSKFHLLTITANKNTNVWKFYQNKTLVFTSTVGNLTFISDANIGREHNSSSWWFEGEMHSFSILNTDLTQAEIDEKFDMETQGFSII